MILVTGSTGQVGRFLVRELTAQGADFKAFVHSEASAARLNAQGLKTVRGDYSHPDTLKAALEGVDKVFILSPSSPAQAELETAIVDAAKQAGSSHLVKLSLLAAGPDQADRFLQTHGQIEEHIKASGLAYTFLRPNFYMQNFESGYAPTIASEGVFYVPAGEAAISFVDTQDVAAVAARVLTREGHAGKTYDITGPAALTFAEAANRLSRLTGQKVQYVAIAPEDARKGLQAMGVPEWMTEGFLELFRFYREGKGAVLTSAVEQLTGRKTRDFDTYLQDKIQLFKKP